MVLKNAPDESRRTPGPEEEEVSLLDRVLQYKVHIAVGILALVILVLAVAVVRGMAESKEADAWGRSRKLREDAFRALALNANAEETLTALESKVDEFAGTSVHPVLLFYLARLYESAERLEDARRTLERLRSEYPSSELTDPEECAPGDTPMATSELNQIQSKIEFFEKMGKPFAERPRTREGLSATLKVTEFGEIKLGFFTGVAPRHAANFIKLAKEGFFDGTTFHRITDFCIQGGDPNSKDEDPKNDGQGGPGWTVEKEIRFNPALHTRGTLSAAASSTSGPDSGSQFFICTRDAEHLDGTYTPFGEVLAGMDVVDKIAQEQTQGENKDGISPDRPIKRIVVEKVTVEGEFALPEIEMPGYLERKKKEEEKEKEKAAATTKPDAPGGAPAQPPKDKQPPEQPKQPGQGEPAPEKRNG
jgi:peptidyl-prolyl cis-trans isomerase B (cyclophilin B)